MMKSIKDRAYFVIVILLLLHPFFGWADDGQDVLRATLTNGLRVVIVKNSLAPAATVEMNYLVGSNEAPEGFPGMAHALEHMMFRGSPGLSAAQLARIIALMGGSFNADTQQSVTQYFFTVPKDDLDTALHVESVRMQGIISSQELWELERGAIEQEVSQDLSNPEYLLSMRLLAELFAGTPYAHDALGTRPSFQETTGAALREFYSRWYSPNNAVLVIAGDVDAQQTLGRVKDLFGKIPERPVPARPAINLQPLKPAAIALDTDQPYGLSVVAYRLPGFDSPDFAAAMILADAMDSKRGNLYSLVPEGKALFAGFESDALPKAGYGFAAAAFPQGKDGAELITTIKNIIAGYVKNGIPDDLIEASKRHEITDAEFRKNSIMGLAELWSQAVAVAGRASPDDIIEALKRVKVDDVNRVAKQYLLNDSAITAILTPRPSGKPVASRSFGGKESFAPQQITSVELPLWASQAAIVPSVPPSKVEPAVMTLSNGIRLIVQPESISPTVTVVGRVKSNDDLQEPAGKDGVSLLLEKLFSYGTTTRDRLAFQEAQDAIGAEISAGTSFSLRVLPDLFERALELLADNLLKPALPEKAFNVVKEETISSLRGQIQSPSYLSGQALREALYPKNDPALRDAQPESVASVTLQDVTSYYAKVFRPDMTTIVVIGQITPERARAVIEKYLGAWKATGERPETDLPSVLPNKPSLSLVPDTSRVQSQVTLAETVGVVRKNPDYYKLELGNHVLSGAFYASRLFRDLREKTGLVYSVNSHLDAGKNRSLFNITYACDPPNVAKARAIVERNLLDMQAAPISPDELQQAKILLLRQIPLSEASMDGIARRLLSRSLQDLPLDEPILAAQEYREMTAEQVRDAFLKWIRPKDFVQITVGPNPE